MTKRREALINALRQRIVGMLETDALKPGDRLPGTRQLATQFGVCPRLVLGAMHALADEGLIERRERSGNYLSAGARWGRDRLARSAPWLAELLAQGVARQLPARQLQEALRLCVEAPPLRAAVVAPSADQVDGICRELRADFGVESVGVRSDDVGAAPAHQPPAPLVGSDFVVWTGNERERFVRAAADRLGKPAVAAGVRADLMDEARRLLLRGPVYAVVADARFAASLMTYLARSPGRHNFVPLVVGRDDLGCIPEDAPVYATCSARAMLAGAPPLRGLLMATARTLSPACAREIFEIIVRRNLAGAAPAPAGARNR